ncbi:MAG: hypothetical protein ACRCWQ_14690 [Bacilli bacterium]
MSNSKAHSSFKSFIQLVGQSEIQRIVSLIYEQLNHSFGQKMRLGEDAYTFCAAVLYTYYRKEMQSSISEILARVWMQECVPHVLKLQIDSVFRRQKETLFPFNEGIQWLKRNATWIEQHDMRSESYLSKKNITTQDNVLTTFDFQYQYHKKKLHHQRVQWLDSIKDRFFYAHDREYILQLAPYWFPTSVPCPECNGTLFDILFPNDMPFHTTIDKIGDVSIYQMFTCPTCLTLFTATSHPLIASDWIFHPIKSQQHYFEAIRTLSYQSGKK